MFLSDSDGFIFGLPWPSKTARQVLCTGCLPYGLRTRRTYNGPDESGRWGRVTDFVALLSDSLEEGREGNLKGFSEDRRALHALVGQQRGNSFM